MSWTTCKLSHENNPTAKIVYSYLLWHSGQRHPRVNSLITEKKTWLLWKLVGKKKQNSLAQHITLSLTYQRKYKHQHRNSYTCHLTGMKQDCPFFVYKYNNIIIILYKFLQQDLHQQLVKQTKGKKKL